jgi:hypothetical protein
MYYCTLNKVEWESGYSVPPYFVKQKLPHVIYYTPSRKRNKDA